MDYKQIISACEESKYLISMVPMERVLEFGHQIGLDANDYVLDFCCGYGEMLKLWSEAFSINGTGIDREPEFIETGRARLTNTLIKLIVGDVLTYNDNRKYDIVICTELSAGLFDNFSDGIAFLENFLKPGGKLVFGRLFSKIPNPPKELTDFDGELPTLCEMNEEVRRCGYYITAMVSSTDVRWERYFTWSAKRDLEKLRQNPNDIKTAAWIDKWYRMYFEHRRPYEEWGLFAIEKL